MNTGITSCNKGKVWLSTTKVGESTRYKIKGTIHFLQRYFENIKNCQGKQKLKNLDGFATWRGRSLLEDVRQQNKIGQFANNVGKRIGIGWSAGNVSEQVRKWPICSQIGKRNHWNLFYHFSLIPIYTPAYPMYRPGRFVHHPVCLPGEWIGQRANRSERI